VLAAQPIRRERSFRGYLVLGDSGRSIAPLIPPDFFSRGLGACCSRTAQSRRTLLGRLGALDPATAAQQVISSQPALNASSKQAITASAAALTMLDASGNPAYIPGTADCSAAGPQTGPNDLQLAQTASGLALTGTTIGLTTAGAVSAAALAPFTLGISAIIGLFPLLFGHHAQAVKAEQSTLCAAVPAANNYLKIIQQAVSTGSATPQEAIDALNSLVSDFQSQVSSILKMDSSHCNAACVMISELKAIVLVLESQYQDMIAAGAPATSGGAGPTSAPVVASGSTMQIPSTPAAAAPSSSLPSWFPLAAIAALGFLLVKVL
jgi:hypothetical protein